MTKQQQQPEDAFQAMNLLGATPTPHIYELFYTYYSTKDVAIGDALEPYFSGAIKWSETAGEALYTKYIADDRLSKIMEVTASEVGEQIETAMKTLDQAGKDAANYEKALAGVGGSLMDETDPGSIRNIVDHLVKATATMQTRSQTLESQLAETNQEVVKLQGNLEKVKEEAMTDALTGLCNRKRFDEALEKARQDAFEEGTSLTLVLCDIDHFKRFNDTWGHQTGDQIIRFVASALKRGMSTRHIAARYGGEEFALIMPKTDLGTAEDISNAIRNVVERKKLVKKSTNEDLGSVTISLGAAVFRNDEKVETLIERADQALYMSKQNGRNLLSTENDLPSIKAA